MTDQLPELHRHVFQVRASSFPPAQVEDTPVASVEAVTEEELNACQVCCLQP